MRKKSKNIWIAIALVAVVLGGLFYTGILDPSKFKTASVANTNVPPNLDTQCVQNPAYTYSAVDAFVAGTVVGGTDQIKSGSDAPVSSLASPKAGVGLQYTKINASYFCELKSDNAQCGSATMQTKCYQNSTPTIAVFSPVDNFYLTSGGGANNVTVAANGVANLRVDVTPVAKKSIAPLGGCVAVEVPNSAASQSLSGAGVGGSCPFVWTYSVSSTSNTYQTYALDPSFDKDGLGLMKSLNLQITAGSTDLNGTAMITFQPAQYYVTNAGSFALGIQKDANADTTKTATGIPYTIAIN